MMPGGGTNDEDVKALRVEKAGGAKGPNVLAVWRALLAGSEPITTVVHSRSTGGGAIEASILSSATTSGDCGEGGADAARAFSLPLERVTRGATEVSG